MCKQWNSLLSIIDIQRGFVFLDRQFSVYFFVDRCLSRCTFVFLVIELSVLLFTYFDYALWYLQSLLSFPDHLYSYYLCGMSVYIDDVSILILYTIFISLHDLLCTYRISTQVILCCLNNTISYIFVCLFTRSIF